MLTDPWTRRQTTDGRTAGRTNEKRAVRRNNTQTNGRTQTRTGGQTDGRHSCGATAAEAAAGVANDTGPRAATRGPQRDLLAFFRVDGGTKDGSCNVYTLSDGTPVSVCPAFCYAYRDARLHVFNPIEFRRRWVAPWASSIKCPACPQNN